MNSNSSSSAWRTTPNTDQDQHKCTGGCFHDKSNQSRRSIDWRDSGIVIDENYLFQSFESIGAFDSRSSITSDQHEAEQCGRNVNVAIAQPIEKIALSQDEDGDTILHLAVVGFPLSKAKDLISLCDLNAINNMMQTPLHVATLAERLEMVQLLMNSGAKLDVYDRRGNTPLHLACQKGFVGIADAIVDAITKNTNKTSALTQGRAISSCNFEGFTCLHLAAMNNQNKIIELLAVKYRADLSARDSKSGETILHKAIRHYNVDLVAFMLDNKLHNLISMTDYSGRTPLDIVGILQEPFNSTVDEQAQFSKLLKIKQLIECGFQACIASAGCCINRSERDIKQVNLDSASSSSDYSDTD